MQGPPAKTPFLGGVHGVWYRIVEQSLSFSPVHGRRYVDNSTTDNAQHTIINNSTFWRHQMTNHQEDDTVNTDPKPQKLTSQMFVVRIESKGQVGPMTAPALRTLANSGNLGREDLVSVANEDKWVPAKSVKGLFESQTIKDKPGQLSTSPDILDNNKYLAGKRYIRAGTLIIIILGLMFALPFGLEYYNGEVNRRSYHQILPSILHGLLWASLPGVLGGLLIALGVSMIKSAHKTISKPPLGTETLVQAKEHFKNKNSEQFKILTDEINRRKSENTLPLIQLDFAKIAGVIVLGLLLWFGSGWFFGLGTLEGEMKARRETYLFPSSDYAERYVRGDSSVQEAIRMQSDRGVWLWTKIYSGDAVTVEHKTSSDSETVYVWVMNNGVVQRGYVARKDIR